MDNLSGDWQRFITPLLEDHQPNAQGEQGMHCPTAEHEDVTRSASINRTKGVWWCQGCHAGGSIRSLLASLAAGTPVVGSSATNGVGGSTTQYKLGAEVTSGVPYLKNKYGNVVEIIDDKQVLEWHEALLSDPDIHMRLTNARGLTLETLSEFMIGWSTRAKAYTIPVPDVEGQWQNIRYYDPAPQDERRKIWSVTGFGEPILYPFHQLIENNSIMVCEGEWDTLLAIQNGFAAVTRTSTADAWRSNWNRFFEGKDVWICHDMDEKGQKANAVVAEQLAGSAKSITIVTLPYPVEKKHGRDLTDFFHIDGYSFREFQELLDASSNGHRELPLVEEEHFLDIGVLETFNAAHYRERIRLRATVVGKKYPTYMVPQAFNVKCSQDFGPKCSVCPMMAFQDGDRDVVIEPEASVLLKFMGATEVRIGELLQTAAGIPGKPCPIARVTVNKLQSLEEIFVRPDIDTHRLSHEAGDYTARTIIAVGHHDTLTNQTVETRGSIWPNPKDQHNEYLASELSLTKTSIDAFTMTAAMEEELRGFSTRTDPLAKAVEIARDLEWHVTGIRGRTEMHVLMDLAFHSILAFPLHGAVLQRGWLDVLVVGDTRTGKSEAASALLWHYGAGELVSGESTSFAGIVGGLEQFGGKEWSIKWGAIPMNDRRLVVIDEVSGLSTEQISNMSSIRSSGEAVITKIHTERTLARTRLIWLGNPREARMSDFTYGVSAIKPLIGNPEDIARFDLAMSLRSGEVDLGVINTTPDRTGGAAFTSEMCNNLLMWCWSRRAEHIYWADGVEEELRHEAMALGEAYVDDPPLIQGENVRTKIARLAVALAARTFNSPDGESLLVEMRHLRGAVRFINKVYGMRSFGYQALSETKLRDVGRSKDLREQARQYLDTKPELVEFLSLHGRFKRQDLEDTLNYTQEEAKATINHLWGFHMLRGERGMFSPQPVLSDIIREGR